MRSIELVLGEPFDAAVRGAWDALTAADLPSLGRSTSPSNRPHVTLAAGEELRVPDAIDAPLPEALRLGGVLLFPAGAGRHVLARAVVVDRPLARFHEAVHAAVPGAVENSLPGRWSPHVTLARRIRDTQLPEALAALAAVPLPEVLAVGGVRHWAGDTRTVTPLA